MPPQWAADYVGLPYVDNGESMAGADCWGLYRMVARQQFGLSVPEYSYLVGDLSTMPAAIAGADASGRWRKVNEPEPGDLVLLRYAGQVTHLAAYLAGGFILHTSRGQDAVCEPLFTSRWRHRIEGFYRYE